MFVQKDHGRRLSLALSIFGSGHYLQNWNPKKKKIFIIWNLANLSLVITECTINTNVEEEVSDTEYSDYDFLFNA